MYKDQEELLDDGTTPYSVFSLQTLRLPWSFDKENLPHLKPGDILHHHNERAQIILKAR